MAQENDGGYKLVRLDDFEGELEEPWQDARGLKIRDSYGEEVGEVEELYIYEAVEAVHLLKAEVDGRHVLIAADAVTTASEDGVAVEQNRETIANSPEFDSDDIPDADTSRATYDHYGYPDQLALG